MKQYKFQSLADTNAFFGEKLKEAACRVIDSGWYLTGRETAAFESELAEALGCAHAVGTANGLEAIRLTFRALIENGRLAPGDTVLVPANTFIASILPLTQLGLRPRLVDPDPETMSVSYSRMADEAEKHPEVKAALPVHLYGLPAFDREGFDRLRDRGIVIVEDNAQAIGAETFDPASGKWLSTGTLGEAAAISFYPAKNIGALGDAGAVVTSDARLAETIRQLSNYGGSVKYHYDYQGYNSRLDEIQAAMLRVKLPYIAAERDRRAETARVYSGSITNPLVALPYDSADVRHAWHQYVVRTPERDRLQAWLEANGVQTMIHYPVPPYRQRCYRGVLEGDFPVADRLAAEVLSLPIANTSPSDAAEIASIINRYS